MYGLAFQRLAKEAQDSLAKANEVAEEVISSMRTVRSFANEHGESRRYDGKMGEVLKVRKRQTYAFIGYTWINEVSSGQYWVLDRCSNRLFDVSVRRHHLTDRCAVVRRPFGLDGKAT